MAIAREETAWWPMTDARAERSDAELVRLAQRDLEAFVALYDRYVDPVFRYCNRRLPRAAAEDATSIAFLNAMRAIGRVDPERSQFRPWLFTIAHNAVVDQLRSRRHLPLEELQLAEPSPSLEDRVIGTERRQRLSEVLATLPPDQQQVMHLRLAGLPNAEIGAVMSKPVGTVRVIHHRAVKRLRELMGIEEATTPDGAERS